MSHLESALLVEVMTDPVLRASSRPESITHAGQTWTPSLVSDAAAAEARAGGGGSTVRTRREHLTVTLVVPRSGYDHLRRYIAPVAVRLLVIGRARGAAWRTLRTLTGKLYDARLENDVLTFSVVGPDEERNPASIIRWSPADHRRRNPDDVGLDGLARLASGIDIRWPNR